jgi:hypothetical protein
MSCALRIHSSLNMFTIFDGSKLFVYQGTSYLSSGDMKSRMFSLKSDREEWGTKWDIYLPTNWT